MAGVAQLVPNVQEPNQLPGANNAEPIGGGAQLPEVFHQVVCEPLLALEECFTNFKGEVHRQTVRFFYKCYLGVVTYGLVSFLAGEIVGKHAFYAVVDRIFGTWASVIVTCALVPLLIWAVGKHLRKAFGREQWPVLLASFVMGLLIGSTLKMSPMRFFRRPRAAMPLGMSLVARVAGLSPTLLDSRPKFVPVMMIPGLVSAMLLGYGLNEMSVWYILYMAVMVVASVIDLQWKINSANDGIFTTLPQETWKSTLVFTMVDLVAVLITGEGGKQK